MIGDDLIDEPRGFIEVVERDQISEPIDGIGSDRGISDVDRVFDRFCIELLGMDNRAS